MAKRCEFWRFCKWRPLWPLRGLQGFPGCFRGLQGPLASSTLHFTSKTFCHKKMCPAACQSLEPWARLKFDADGQAGLGHTHTLGTLNPSPLPFKACLVRAPHIHPGPPKGLPSPPLSRSQSLRNFIICPCSHL